MEMFVLLSSWQIQLKFDVLNYPWNMAEYIIWESEPVRLQMVEDFRNVVR